MVKFSLCIIQVAVLVELKARFDEVRNMGFAQKLEVSYWINCFKNKQKCDT